MTGNKRKVSQKFYFYSRGLKQGDVIIFVDGENITSIASYERHVWYHYFVF